MFKLANGVFPKCFTEFREFCDTNICHYSKRARTCRLLCERPRCYHSASKTGRSLNWGQFWWFIRFSEFTEFNNSSAPFRKTPMCNTCSDWRMLISQQQMLKSFATMLVTVYYKYLESGTYLPCLQWIIMYGDLVSPALNLFFVNLHITYPLPNASNSLLNHKSITQSIFQLGDIFSSRYPKEYLIIINWYSFLSK